MLRRWLFQVHLWTGLIAGVYISVIGVTGAAVVFRQDMQAAAYPEFFRLKPEATSPSSFRLQPEEMAGVSTLIRELAAAYPGYRLSGVDWPTYRRETFLAYVSRGSEFRTVFAHPVSGTITGELPQDRIGWLQDLHFNLLAGRTGRIINGIGAACVLVMCLTGLVIAWPWLARWIGHPVRRWTRVTWELHGTVGVWLWLLLVMWGLTGLYFVFPQPFRTAINAISPLTATRAPDSDPSRAGRQPAPAPEALIARAQQMVPGAQVARLVLPATDRGAVLVLMARATHGDYDTTDEVSLYFDRYTGEILQTRDHGVRSVGDAVTAWINPLHVGSFGGLPVKILWAIGGLALPLLFVTGALMWWSKR